MLATVEMQLIRLSFGNLSKDDSQPAIISTLQDDTVSVTLVQLWEIGIFEYIVLRYFIGTNYVVW